MHASLEVSSDTFSLSFQSVRKLPWCVGIALPSIWPGIIPGKHVLYHPNTDPRKERTRAESLDIRRVTDFLGYRARPKDFRCVLLWIHLCFLVSVFGSDSLARNVSPG